MSDHRPRLSRFDRVGMSVLAAVLAAAVVIYLGVGFAPEMQILSQLFR